MVTKLLRTAGYLSLFLIALPVHAAVSAQLSARNIDELDTVQLSVKVTETRQSQALDLSKLETDFHVLNTNTITQSRYINGRGQSWVEYKITLQPKRTGKIIIPGIEVGSQRTPSLELQVRPLSTRSRRKIDELVFFENEVSTTIVYVQSQLILTRRLLYSQGVQLYTDLPGAPDIPDAVVITLGETRSETTQRNQKTYGVVEQQYAIFPESSGSFTVPGISITASVQIPEGNRVSRKGVRVGTEDVHIDVLPVPPEYPRDRPWLPAEKVTLFDMITPDPGAHQVGDTFTHELLVHIAGNVGTMAPPLPLPADEDAFRIYPQTPKIEDDTSTGSVKGSRLQTHSLLPLKPGTIILPPSELVWWDTVHERVRISSTKPRTFNIQGQAVPRTPSPPDTQHANATQVENKAQQPAVLDWRELPSYLFYLMLIAALTGMGWILAHGWFKSRLNRPSSPRHMAYLKKSLDNALAHGTCADIHRTLTDYLVGQYNLPGYQALAELSNASPGTASALDALSKELYGIEDTHFFTPRHRDILRNAVGTIENSRAHDTPGLLPPLYSQAT